jgi:hypothetical protein
MLIEYFKKKKTDEDAHKVFYANSKGGEKFWNKRKKANMFQARRIVQAHPAEGEHYHLRILLNNVIGARSFKELRTIKDVEYHTFR